MTVTTTTAAITSSSSATTTTTKMNSSKSAPAPPPQPQASPKTVKITKPSILPLPQKLILPQDHQLYQVLQAFSIAYPHLIAGTESSSTALQWTRRMYRNLVAIDITTPNDLIQGCRDHTINLDLELFGIPPEEYVSEELQTAL
jgi:hypothetical protein